MKDPLWIRESYSSLDSYMNRFILAQTNYYNAILRVCLNPFFMWNININKQIKDFVGKTNDTEKL